MAYTEKDAHRLAQAHGGRVEKYRKAGQKIDFRCHLGHRFALTFNQILNHDRWCPHCHAMPNNVFAAEPQSGLQKEEQLLIYTDGSVRDGIGSTWAFAVFRGRQEIYHDYGTCGVLHVGNVLVAEIHAVLMAVRWLAQSPYEKAVICHDAEAVGTRPRIPPPPAKDKTGRADTQAEPPKATENQRVWRNYWKIIAPFLRGQRITFRKVKGHGNDWHNALVDGYCNLAYDSLYKLGKVERQRRIDSAAAKRRINGWKRRHTSLKLRVKRYRHHYILRIKTAARHLGSLLLQYGNS